jgi:Spy/CpxP family protein refolding chaperone
MKIGTLFLAATLAGGALFAQDQTTAPRKHSRPATAQSLRAANHPLSERWLNQNLTLTAEQSTKIHSILSDARTNRQADLQKRMALHKSLSDAVKSGNEAQIDSVSRDLAGMRQQEHAAHVKALAKVYQTLTPEQQAKVAPEIDKMMGAAPRAQMRRPLKKNQ